MHEWEARIARLEASNRRLGRAALGLVAGLVALVFWSAAPARSAPDDPGILRTRMLEIVDAAGVVRVRVGSALPDAVIDGKQVGRGGEAVAGVMLYDATGQERGGYVTFEPSGNIGLTLDTRKGQVALFAAGPEDGATLRLWSGAEAIELRADGDGARLTAAQNGAAVLQLPPVASIGGEACAAYRGALSSLPRAEVEQACAARFPEALCRQCLAD